MSTQTFQLKVREFYGSASHQSVYMISSDIGNVNHHQLLARAQQFQGVYVMSITELPPPSTTAIFERLSAARKAEVVRELSALLGARYVLHTPYDLMLYEYDASIDRSTPDIVVMPASTEDVVAIVKIADRYNVPVVPRGAGTGLSGGAVPVYGGIVIVFSRMNRVLEVDYDKIGRAHV